MTYEAKNYDHLLGLDGFSDDLLKNHFTLYQGYVTNTNKAAELMKTLEPGSYEVGEVRRRFGWEWNGMRLHEYYFGNMTKDASARDENSAFSQKLIDTFGSYEAWEKDFRAAGGMRGIGWVILAHDTEEDRLFNTWINEHDLGHLAGAQPLLVMDVFEHAFMIDYGLKKAEYIDAFFRAIDWGKVEKRFGA